MTITTTTQRPTRAATTAPKEAPGSNDQTDTPEAPDSEMEVEDGWDFSQQSLLEAGQKGFSYAVGATAAFTAAVVYGCAGAAEGFVHGASIPQDQQATIRSGLMAGNLAAVGALGGLGGSAVAVATGVKVWKETPVPIKEEVVSKVHSWTEKANQWVDSVWSTPEEGAPTPMSRRIVGGIVGELAGGGAGVMVGVTKAFSFGQQIQQALTDDYTPVSEEHAHANS